MQYTYCRNRWNRACMLILNDKGRFGKGRVARVEEWHLVHEACRPDDHVNVGKTKSIVEYDHALLVDILDRSNDLDPPAPRRT